MACPRGDRLRPVHEGAQAITHARQGVDVDGDPREPRDEAAEVELADFADGTTHARSRGLASMSSMRAFAVRICAKVLRERATADFGDGSGERHGLPPMMTKVGSLRGTLQVASRSAASNSPRTRARISRAWASVFNPGATAPIRVRGRNNPSAYRRRRASSHRQVCRRSCARTSGLHRRAACPSSTRILR